jgi:AraC family transcriptional regulator
VTRTVSAPDQPVVPVPVRMAPQPAMAWAGGGGGYGMPQPAVPGYGAPGYGYGQPPPGYGFLPVDVEWKEDGHYRKLRVVPGESAILPAGVVFTSRTNDVGEFISLTINQKFVHCVVHEAMEHGLELKLTRVVNDPLLHAIALAFRREVQSGYAGGAAYGESLGSTLIMHLVRHHATKRLPVAADRGGLGKRQLRRAIEYIHDHLGEDLSLASVAAQSGLSMFHFARMFKQATGLTPHQYILRSRLTQAKQLLTTSSDPVADVAYRVGFYDQSHFTAHFKRAFGLTPRIFRNQLTTR